MYLIVVIYNVTGWQQWNLVSVHVFVAAVLFYVLGMRRKNGSTVGYKYDFLCSDVA
jgi:hypothetical protein